MFKRFWLLSAFLISFAPFTAAWAQPSAAALHAATQMAAKGLEGCSMQRDNVMHKMSADQKHMIFVLPYEGCGGGNNWGQQVMVFSHFDGKRWKRAHELSLTGVESIQVKGNFFVVDTLGYGPDDARCCPTMNSTHNVPIPKE